MIRALAIIVMLTAVPAHAKEKPFRLGCTLDGKPFAEWRKSAGQYRLKLDGKWSDVSAGAVGPMILLMWADGAKCGKR
jgi:hypothetical protein